jgi:hypothetical protein
MKKGKVTATFQSSSPSNLWVLTCEIRNRGTSPFDKEKLRIYSRNKAGEIESSTAITLEALVWSTEDKDLAGLQRGDRSKFSILFLLDEGDTPVALWYTDSLPVALLP